MRQIIQLFAFLSLSLFTLMASAQNVQTYMLPNGLKLIVKEDHRAPVVVSQVWYKVGSSYEPLGITGISHALEHMMFRGTQKYGPGQLAKIVAENGGEENAFTSSDYTAYYQVLDASKLPISFQLESDRMRGLLLNPSDFSKEIQVVMEERRLRIEDNPQQRTLERFLATAFVSTGYHHPIIGWMSDLQSMTAKDLRQWYDKWYAPNNAVLVVVGDVKPEEVHQLALKYFGPLKPSVLPEIKPQKEIASVGEREIKVKFPAQLPWLVMGYNVPVVKTAKTAWEPYALDVLTGILDAGDSSRLSKDLVRGKQIAASVDVSYDLFSRLSQVLSFSATPAPGHTIAELRDAFLQQVKQLQNAEVTPQELARVKAQVIASKTYDKDSIENQATEIGSLEAVGLSWQLSDEYVKNIEAVTPQQIQAVAQKYLKLDRLTVVELSPLPLPQGYTPPTTPVGETHVR